MPNFDTGHYFLTTLAPIRNGATRDDNGTVVSYQQKLRMALALLPTALQSPATVKTGINSPFARNMRTHLCRFMVLDDVICNGRDRSNAISNSIRGRDPIQPETFDRLNCGYLMFAADIDAVTADGDPLPVTATEDQQDAVRDAYARTLWETMEPELREIYGNCEGFGAVETADDFAIYLMRCQVETTMPFNDYWISPPRLNPLPAKPLVAALAVPLIVMLLGLLGWLAQSDPAPILGNLFGWTSGKTFLGGLGASLVAIFAAYRYVLWNGRRPMPPGEYADLPSVLKSLYLQQTFTRFATDMQGKSPAELHAAFASFLDEHRPQDKMAPTQAPGVISIDHANAVIR